tara:strand:- start:7277 stop:7507 length:231 start_codon:yes stop_codon:yes gene_type:complete
MIDKMKRTPKAKHGYKVWLRQSTLKSTIDILHKMLECAEEVVYLVDVQYQKPSVLVYTDNDAHAEWFDKMIKEEQS